MRSAIALALALLLAPAVSTADIIYVDVAGGDHETLQEGFAAADTGDTILVAPGVYSGPLNRDIEPYGKNVKFISEAGPEQTIIDCEGIDLAFFYNNGEDSTSVVDGFTIQNGFRNSRGGAIPIYSASPIIKNCIFKDCSASTGGAISIRYLEAQPKILNCVFLNNYAGANGGAIYLLTQATLTAKNCVFAGNETAGYGHAMHITGGTHVSFANCTFYGNTGVANTPGIVHSSTAGQYTNCVFSFGGDRDPISCGGSPQPTITHCISFGHTSSDSLCGNHYDNMFVDPLFCNVFDDNFELCSNSPSLAANNAWGELVGAYGQGCGDCDAPVENTAWSAIKSVFR
jgi:predicted outer membrane repeat protein